MVRQSQGHSRAQVLPALLIAAGTLLAGPGLLNFVAGIAGAGPSALRRAPGARSQGQAVAARALGILEGTTEAKEKLFDLLDDDMLLGELLKPESKSIRGRVDEAVLQLERLNPTEEPVYSELIDGTWKIKYTGTYSPGLLSSPTRELALFLYSGGFSPGNALASLSAGFWGQTLGLKLGARKVTIKEGREAEATADLEFGGRSDTLRYKADLMPMSASRMSEEVVEVVLPEPLGKQEAPFELRRTMLVTYLDDAVMIVRDESGVAEVLVREPKAEVPEEPAVKAAVPAANTTAAANTTQAGTSKLEPNSTTA